MDRLPDPADGLERSSVGQVTLGELALAAQGLLEREESLGEPSSIDAVPGLVRSALLPDVEEPRYLEKLRACARSCSSVDEALALTTTVVLTSPEYHLV